MESEMLHYYGRFGHGMVGHKLHECLVFHISRLGWGREIPDQFVGPRPTGIEQNGSFLLCRVYVIRHEVELQPFNVLGPGFLRWCVFGQ